MNPDLLLQYYRHTFGFCFEDNARLLSVCRLESACRVAQLKVRDMVSSSIWVGGVLARARERRPDWRTFLAEWSPRHAATGNCCRGRLAGSRLVGFSAWTRSAGDRDRLSVGRELHGVCSSKEALAPQVGARFYQRAVT